MFAGGTAASNSAVMDKTMVGGDEESKDPKTPENEGESEEVPESKTGEAGHGKTTERVTTDIESKNANTGERLQMPLLQPKIREEELEERRKILTDIENNKTDNARERSQMLLLQLKKREEELEERRKMLTKSKTIRVWSADAPEKQSILDKTALRSNDTKKKAESNAIVIHLANRWATKWREENKTQILKVAEIASDNAKKQRRRERAIVELEVSAERRKRREGGWIEGERCKERERIGRLPRVVSWSSRLCRSGSGQWLTLFAGMRSVMARQKVGGTHIRASPEVVQAAWGRATLIRAQHCAAYGILPRGFQRA